MDLEDRIRRRQRRTGNDSLVRDCAALSPVSHVAEPIDRGTVLEGLLDLFDPVFDGELPPAAYLWGECGSGKSAVAVALCRRLSRLPMRSDSIVQTATRARSRTVPAFVYQDGREAVSEFSLYYGLLDGLSDDRIPRRGVGTTELWDRVTDELADRRAVAVVDHTNEPGTLSAATVAEHLSPLEDRLSLVCVGRDGPDELDWNPPAAINTPSYRPYVLVDVVSARADDALGGDALDHAQAMRIAEWAEGNAHDALSALFVATDAAANAGRDRIEVADVEAAIADIPHPSISLGRVLSLPENRQSVLRELVAFDENRRNSVDEATTAIAEAPRIGLSSGTVRRFLYELAEDGILERIEVDHCEAGRPPSRLVERFSPTVFSRLYDRQKR